MLRLSLPMSLIPPEMRPLARKLRESADLNASVPLSSAPCASVVAERLWEDELPPLKRNEGVNTKLYFFVSFFSISKLTSTRWLRLLPSVSPSVNSGLSPTSADWRLVRCPDTRSEKL